MKNWFEEIQKNTIFKVFFALTIIITTYFVILGISIWKNYEINFLLMLGISLAMPAAIYYGILICDILFKKG